MTGQFAAEKEPFHFHLSVVVAWLMEPCMLAAADGSWTSSSVAWLTATSATENILLKAPSFHSVAAVNSWFFGQRPVSNTAKQINRQDKSIGPDFVVSAVSSMALRESSTGLSEAAGQRNPEYWPPQPGTSENSGRIPVFCRPGSLGGNCQTYGNKRRYT